MGTVLITANTSWYVYNFRRNTISFLRQKGYRIVVAAPNDSYSERLVELGVAYVDVRLSGASANPFRDLVTFFDFCKIYRDYSIDVALNFTPKNNIYSTLAGKVFGVKSINNIAGLGMVFVGNSIRSKLVKLLYRCSQPFAKKIFFQNDEDRKYLCDANVVSASKVEVLPGSGVDLERFVFSPSKDDGVVRFILVARMIVEKGIFQYAEAAERLKQSYGAGVEFYLLGPLDSLHPSAVQLACVDDWSRRGLLVYLGASDCVEDELKGMDCVVLPSYYREGIPRSLLEAAAMGKPIVTADNIGCNECIIDKKSGFLCEPKSVESLVEKLELVYSMSHQDRLKMGAVGRKLVEDKFDEKIVISRYVTAIEECLEHV